MPGRLSAAVVRKQIAGGVLEPLYLVTGDDEAEMTALASACAASVDEEMRAFNVQRFFGTDPATTLAAVFDAASTLPLLAPRRVVLLVQAERVLAARRRAAAGADDETEGSDREGDGGKPSGQLALLKEYAKHPHPHAVVVIAGTGLAKTFEPLARQAAVVLCEIPLDALGALEREHGVRFDREAAEVLRQRTGADPARLRAEVERIVLYAAGQRAISRQQVEDVVGRASAAGGKKLWSEVASRRAVPALRELALEMAEGAVPFMILGLLRSVVERTVSARDLPSALDALLRTDLALKTSGGDPQVLLERLVVELCGMGRE